LDILAELSGDLRAVAERISRVTGVPVNEQTVAAILASDPSIERVLDARLRIIQKLKAFEVLDKTQRAFVDSLSEQGGLDAKTLATSYTALLKAFNESSSATGSSGGLGDSGQGAFDSLLRLLSPQAREAMELLRTIDANQTDPNLKSFSAPLRIVDHKPNTDDVSEELG